MKLENLTDKSLFRILKVVYDNIDKLDELYMYYPENKTQETIKEVLRNLGVTDEFLEIQYIYLCLEKNWNLMESGNLSTQLVRPKKKKYLVDVEQKVYKTCIETYQHVIESYDVDKNIAEQFQFMLDDEHLYASDGDYIDDNCETDEIGDIEISNIKKIN